MTTKLKANARLAAIPKQPGIPIDLPSESPPTDVQANAFRPLKRPPIAKVHLMDDDLLGSESIRLRAQSTLLGRDCSGISIPHDTEISKRHAQIRRLLRHGVYQWMLEDLDSCNGTFVRVRRCRLKQGRKFQIGSRIFSVSFTQHDSKSDSTDSHGRVASLGTSLFAPALPGNEKPTRIALVECTRERKPMILELPSQECHLGSDGRVCQLIIDDDPWLDGRHVRFFIDAQNRWVIEDMASVNGLWVGIHAFRLRDRTWIQMGEQRLLFCAPLVLPSHTQS